MGMSSAGLSNRSYKNSFFDTVLYSLQNFSNEWVLGCERTRNCCTITVLCKGASTLVEHQSGVSLSCCKTCRKALLISPFRRNLNWFQRRKLFKTLEILTERLIAEHVNQRALPPAKGS